MSDRGCSEYMTGVIIGAVPIIIMFLLSRLRTYLIRRRNKENSSTDTFEVPSVNSKIVVPEIGVDAKLRIKGDTSADMSGEEIRRVRFIRSDSSTLNTSLPRSEKDHVVVNSEIKACDTKTASGMDSASKPVSSVFSYPETVGNLIQSNSN